MIPHPSLPFFITYGIDSTAKLWRATVPVDLNVDDSVEVGVLKLYASVATPELLRVFFLYLRDDENMLERHHIV